jgi:hypothetical protein
MKIKFYVVACRWCDPDHCFRTKTEAKENLKQCTIHCEACDGQVYRIEIEHK